MPVTTIHDAETYVEERRSFYYSVLVRNLHDSAVLDRYEEKARE